MLIELSEKDGKDKLRLITVNFALVEAIWPDDGETQIQYSSGRIFTVTQCYDVVRATWAKMLEGRK